MLRTHDKGDNTAENTETVYPENGIPVYTLIIENISGETEDEIRNYFSRFGDVEAVKLLRASDENPDENKFHNGYVTFAKAEYAARVLNNAEHVLLGKNLVVKPAGSCHQLKISRKSIRGAESKDIASTGRTLSIVELNDDCLGHVFAFLSQSEMFRVAFLSKRFFNLIKYQIKSYKHLDLNHIHDDFTIVEAERILSAFGDLIKRLRLISAHAAYRKLLEMIPKYCRNLEEIDFRNFDRISSDTLFQILPVCKQLKSLTLERCDLDKKVFELLEALIELKSLDISNNYEITGEYLKNLKSLKHLNISNCSNIQTRHFTDMWESGIKLKELTIEGFYQLDYEALISTQIELESLTITCVDEAEYLKFIDHLPILKHLRIYDYDFRALCTSLKSYGLSSLRKKTLESLEIYFPICASKVDRDSVLSLKNLKKLSIVNDPCLDDKYLMEIGESCKQLGHINISRSCRQVTKNGIINLVQNLENLIFLDISPARKCDSTLLNAICDVLKKRKNKMLQRFTLAVGSEFITAENWKSKSYSEHRTLMTLSFREGFLDAGSGDGDYDTDDTDYELERYDTDDTDYEHERWTRDRSKWYYSDSDDSDGMICLDVRRLFC